MECKNPTLASSPTVSSSLVVELQTTLTSRELRNAGILPATPPMCESPGSPSSKEKAAQLKLKEPRDLYSTTTLLHPIRWPVECQVIPERIKHIDEAPCKLESYYVCNGKEPQPQPVGVEMGTVVYDYQPKLSVDYFCRATVGGSQELQVFESEPSSLRFESRFESGNLAKAIKVTNMYYELYLRHDLYTERHAQWFYFRIQNTKENVPYRFSIVNFNKPDSLYRYGLKVLMYSEKDAQINNVGWVRSGTNITYFKNDISPDENGPYYTLTFNMKFRHNNDTVYLAQCYPYTYSTLQNYLKSIEDDEFKSQLLTIRLLCRSLAGNNVHILTVTSPDNHLQEESSKKPVVVISARVHPGETQSSYMMKGIIDFLTSDCSQAKELRDRFIFKLIPMLNPDGVIVGNSRCCLLGQDLNRQYRTVLREAFPQIYHAKVMLRKLQEEHGIFLYCDLHGHSRRHNIFIYGCENRRIPEKRLLEQVFPLMMHKNAADKFSFQNCKFKIQKTKEGTGRIFVWTLGVVNSYTLEISLGGSTMPSRQFTHFSTADYEGCGRHFCETLLDYSDTNPVKESLREKILQKLLDGGSTAEEPKNVVLSDYSSLSHSETDGENDSGDEADGEDRNTSGLLKVPSGSGGPLSSPTSQAKLKRQVSVRKHHHHHSRNKSASSAGKVPPQKTYNDRSPLPIHKASVDFTKIKQRKLEEPIVFHLPESLLDESSLITPSKESSSSKDKEISAAYKRLTKFRRKSRRTPSSTGIGDGSIESSQQHHHHSHSHHYQLTAKCTRILFDDPFNPPGSLNLKPHRRSMEVDVDDDGPLLQSGTEDECDPYDDIIKNHNFYVGGTNKPIIKITDCDPEGGSGINGNYEGHPTSLADEMSRLKIGSSFRGVAGGPGRNSSSKSDSESYPQLPSFPPFQPSFPVGKAFLHQTFYTDLSGTQLTAPGTSKEGGQLSRMKPSLSDNAIATSAASSSSSPQMKPIARRSSISYMVNNATIASTAASLARSKLQATGNTIVGSSSSINTNNVSGSNPRRRVSWTGTLTVSVPNVPMVRSTANFHHNQRKKSFRKSKSLNDKQTPNGSSIDIRGGDTSTSNNLFGVATSVDKNIASGSKYSSSRMSTQPASSMQSFSSAMQNATTKRRRAKLKRTKHK
ncbi:unnamed protein product [Orchesella dallaii]|uniref:Peptidase M14 domain-containing protein n=1 Tax=Orchesella dallaii TaxID=48710 RepID=A0ABP1Q752_9HEXA